MEGWRARSEPAGAQLGCLLGCHSKDKQGTASLTGCGVRGFGGEEEMEVCGVMGGCAGWCLWKGSEPRDLSPGSICFHSSRLSGVVLAQEPPKPS